MLEVSTTTQTAAKRNAEVSHYKPKAKPTKKVSTTTQTTTKRNAEVSHYEPETRPTKKVEKMSSFQPTHDSRLRLASATNSSLSESDTPSLTSDSSVKDSSSCTANSVVKNSSSAPSTTGAPSASVSLEKPRWEKPEPLSWDELLTMTREEMKAYTMYRGWPVSPDYETVPMEGIDGHPDMDYQLGLGEYGPSDDE